MFVCHIWLDILRFAFSNDNKNGQILTSAFFYACLLSVLEITTAYST